MKKLFSFLMSFVLILSLSVILSACGSEKTFKGTLEADELYFGGSADNKIIKSTNGEISLKGPAYYDYSEIKIYANGKEVDGLFTMAEINYGNNDVNIGTINPKKLTANATITVTGIKDRYAYFTYMDFEDTEEYNDLKNRYQSYYNTYITNLQKSNDESLTEEERRSATIDARNAKSSLEYQFEGVLTGFNDWYSSKMMFINSYSLKLSEKDRVALTTAPLKDQVITGTINTYGSLVSDDGYIGLSYLSKIKNGNVAYQFEYTYKELTTQDDNGYTMGMLPIRSILPLGRDTISTRSWSQGNNVSLQFNKIRLLDDNDGNQVFGKLSEYDRDTVLSLDVYTNGYNVSLADDYAYSLFLKMYEMHTYTTYAIDPTGVKYSNFSLTTMNQKFNGFAKLNVAGFEIKGIGNNTYTIDNLGQLYLFTNEYGNKSVVYDKIVIYKITVGDEDPVYHYGEILFNGDNARLDVEWDSYIYYDYNSKSLTSLGDPDVTDQSGLVQVKRGMVENITDESNRLVTENDIDHYYYEIDLSASGREEFSASVNKYSFDIVLDSEHNIDWSNVKVSVGGFANNHPVNLVELKDDYGSYEIKDYYINSSGLKTTKVLHCELNLFKGGSITNITSAEDVYYPIHFVNKSDLVGEWGISSSSYNTYFIQVEGADFSNATDIVKIKGTCNTNPEAFENYDNSNMAVYKNSDGSAYTVVVDEDVMGTDITGPYFVLYGQNFQTTSATNLGINYISDISTITIDVKKDGSELKTINVKNYLTENYAYNSGDPISMSFGGNGGYYFAETEGNYKFHVFIHAEEVFDGRVNNTMKYISEIVIAVEDISGTIPSQNLQGFFEFDINISR